MIEIKIPKLGPNMENATLVKWMFVSSSNVPKDAIILIIETDKVTFEVPAPASGLLYPVVSDGTTCNVGETVGYLAETQAEYEMLLNDQSLPQISRVETSGQAPFNGSSPPPVQDSSSRSYYYNKQRIMASPLAKAMASEYKLDLGAITGSGPNGRIIKADILEFMAMRTESISQQARQPDSQPSPVAGATNGTDNSVLEIIPIQGVRRIIFENMHNSLSQSAQLTLHTEASAEQIINLRNNTINYGYKVSYNSIFIKICATALRLHPKINASVDMNQILIWREIHIGLAMELDEGLIVPVIRNPDAKTISTIDKEVIALINKAKERKLVPHEIANGTFTITNLGFVDVDNFTPIIRPPESAILGIGRIVEKPWVKNGVIVPEKRITLSLTFDHRIIDGGPAGRFLRSIKEMVEEPLRIVY